MASLRLTHILSLVDVAQAAPRAAASAGPDVWDLMEPEDILSKLAKRDGEKAPFLQAVVSEKWKGALCSTKATNTRNARTLASAQARYDAMEPPSFFLDDGDEPSWDDCIEEAERRLEGSEPTPHDITSLASRLFSGEA